MFFLQRREGSWGILAFKYFYSYFYVICANQCILACNKKGTW